MKKIKDKPTKEKVKNIGKSQGFLIKNLKNQDLQVKNYRKPNKFIVKQLSNSKMPISKICFIVFNFLATFYF